MRFRLRLIVLLAAGITLVALLVAWSEVRAQQFAVQLDLQERTKMGAEWLREIVEPLLQSGSTPELPAIVERFGSRERLGGVAIYDGSGQPLAISSTLSDWIGGQPAIRRHAAARPPRAAALSPRSACGRCTSTRFRSRSR